MYLENWYVSYCGIIVCGLCSIALTGQRIYTCLQGKPPRIAKQKSHYVFPSTLPCFEFPLCDKREIMAWEMGKVRLGSWRARRRESSSRRHKGRRCKGLSRVPGKLGMMMEEFPSSLICLCSFPGSCGDLAKSCHLLNGVICRDIISPFIYSYLLHRPQFTFGPV